MSITTGLKTKFFRGTTEVADVASIGPPQPERATVDVPELNPPDETQRKLAGVIDAGEVTVTMNLNPDNVNQGGLDNDFRTGGANRYQIVLPTGYGWEFDALCVAYQAQDIEADGVVQVVARFALTGLHQFKPISI